MTWSAAATKTASLIFEHLAELVEDPLGAIGTTEPDPRADESVPAVVAPLVWAELDAATDATVDGLFHETMSFPPRVCIRVKPWRSFVYMKSRRR